MPSLEEYAEFFAVLERVLPNRGLPKPPVEYKAPPRSHRRKFNRA